MYQNRRRSDSRDRKKSARPTGRGGNAARAPRKRNARQADFDISQFVKKAIITTESAPYNPKHRFADFAMHDKLKANVAARGYVHPTPIQDGAIPHILNGRDVIGIANTGTGKTAAFLLPLIHKAFKHPAEKALIIIPTRELALQIDEELKDFSKGSGLVSALCIGGAHLDQQIRQLARRPSFVIGTPGRLKDLIERGHLHLETFNNIVLDEVDRMLDMGFIRDIRYLIALLKSPRQSLFFSATMPAEIAELAKKLLSDPVTVSVRSRATAENVEQDIVRVSSREEKIEVLHQLLLEPEFQKVLVFGRTKYGVEKLAKNLIQRGFRADSIHGDKSQSQRQRALKKFKEDEIAILVATDVAARGLDIPDVTHVINYDLPESYEDYIHRIGRTGRGSKTGNALTFVE